MIRPGIDAPGRPPAMAPVEKQQRQNG